MRVFTVSDIHVDYAENLHWVLSLSEQDYRQDYLILAGDVSDDLDLLAQVFESLSAKFKRVLFVPGNHELWIRKEDFNTSLDKLSAIESLCSQYGICTTVLKQGELSFVPLLSWYDYSFGQPLPRLSRLWRDLKVCKWPAKLHDPAAVSEYFLDRNEAVLDTNNKVLISYSHFVPGVAVMPQGIPQSKRWIYPVLGSERLGAQVRQLNPNIHVYGHSHVNQSVEINGIRYVNNAFAYPSEVRIAQKKLRCIYDSKVKDSKVKNSTRHSNQSSVVAHD